jgi:hypothetical protein
MSREIAFGRSFVWRPLGCLLVVLGLLIGREAGLLVTGGKRVARRKA